MLINQDMQNVGQGQQVLEGKETEVSGRDKTEELNAGDTSKA